jgi:hypothetical protein
VVVPRLKDFVGFVEQLMLNTTWNKDRLVCKSKTKSELEGGELREAQVEVPVC